MKSPDDKILIAEINDLLPQAAELNADLDEFSKVRQKVEAIAQELNEAASRWDAISTGKTDEDASQAAILMRLAFWEASMVMLDASKKLEAMASKAKTISGNIGEIVADDGKGLP